MYGIFDFVMPNLRYEDFCNGMRTISCSAMKKYQKQTTIPTHETLCATFFLKLGTGRRKYHPHL